MIVRIYLWAILLFASIPEVPTVQFFLKAEKPSKEKKIRIGLETKQKYCQTYLSYGPKEIFSHLPSFKCPFSRQTIMFLPNSPKDER
jgi:hypothetical protein